ARAHRPPTVARARPRLGPRVRRTGRRAGTLRGGVAAGDRLASVTHDAPRGRGRARRPGSRPDARRRARHLHPSQDRPPPRAVEGIRLTLTPAEAHGHAIEAPLGPVLVVAGPGAGKTYCLIARIGHLIVCHGLVPRRICAVTFTNKAADEITARLRREVGADAE